MELDYDPIPESGCHIFIGSLDTYGYGQIGKRIDGKYVKFKAHRLAYEAKYGSIPEGMGVLHKCDIRSCINPDHMFLGTNTDNVADMVAKGRNRNHGGMKGEDHPGSILTDKQIRYAREMVADGRSHEWISGQLGVARTTISRIHRQEGWDHV